MKAAFHCQEGENRKGYSAEASHNFTYPGFAHTPRLVEDKEGNMIHCHGAECDYFQCTAAECVLQSR